MRFEYVSGVSTWEPPPWWPLFVRLERALGTRLEGATRSEEFADAMTRLARLQGTLRHLYRTATAEALHGANLPAWSDLLALRDQVTALERRVDDLSLSLEKLAADPRPRSSRRPRRSSDR